MGAIDEHCAVASGAKDKLLDGADAGIVVDGAAIPGFAAAGGEEEEGVAGEATGTA
jgi:hypothetical protein